MPTGSRNPVSAIAELIRLQCLGDNDRRLHQLLDKWAVRWAGPIARHAYSFAFHRGFAEEITIESGILLRHAPELFAAAPIRLLRVIGVRGMMERFFDLTCLTRIRALHLTDCKLGNEGAALLANCLYLDRLQTLRLGGNSIGDRGVEYLADSFYLGNLQSLVLHGNLIGDAGASHGPRRRPEQPHASRFERQPDRRLRRRGPRQECTLPESNATRPLLSIQGLELKLNPARPILSHPAATAESA